MKRIDTESQTEVTERTKDSQLVVQERQLRVTRDQRCLTGLLCSGLGHRLFLKSETTMTTLSVTLASENYSQQEQMKCLNSLSAEFR